MPQKEVKRRLSMMWKALDKKEKNYYSVLAKLEK